MRPCSLLLLPLTLLALSGCGVHRRFGHDPALVYPTNHALTPALLPGKYGGSLSYPLLSDPKTFNPVTVDDADSSQIIGPLYDSLDGRDSFTLKFEPRMAFPPKISKDGLVYTYTLRPGLKWSDGQPLTADDVIFTLQVTFDPKIFDPAREAMLIDVPQPGGKVKEEPFQYKKLDDRTVQFTLPTQWAPAEGLFTFSVLPKHVLEKPYLEGRLNSYYSTDTPPSQMVSCGPYVMSQYVANQRLIYKPNPNYWEYGPNHQRMPYLSQIIFPITPDLNGMVLNFRSGGSDVLDVPPSLFPAIARYAQRDNYTMVDDGPSWGFNYVCFNQNPHSTMSRTPALLHLFQQQKFRQAISYAIDRPTICNLVFRGLAQPLYSPETPADTIYYDPNVARYSYDPQKAQQLLAEVGAVKGPDGILRYQGQPIQFNIITNVENNERKGMAIVIQSELAALGMKVTATPINFNDMIRRVDAPPYDWQAMVGGFTGGPEINDGAAIWRSAGDYHQWWPDQKTPATPWEARIDADFSAGAHTLDIAQRKKYYDDFQEILGQQQPFIFTVTSENHTAIRNQYGNLQPTAFYGLGGSVWNLEQIFSTHATGVQPTS